MTAQSITARAVNLLSRREHSQAELRTKLRKAEFELDEINITIDKLAEADIQSDARFAENYLRYRSQRGFGSQKIRLELKERGVDSDTIDTAFKQADVDWFELAITVRNKRFGVQAPDNLKDRAKQQRFLQYRGFTHEQINESLNS
ncbi:MAG: regulatory protein RecX [Piscirickettsiaceae bacterium]|nr:regulatory protein RecX [Piscirickettsiaceae bacterium]